jgi:thioredoxin domain-containing protein 5/protein disulfide-isomerase
MAAFQSANNKVLAIEEYVKNHVKTTLFGVILFFAIIFYALKYALPFHPTAPC